LINFRNTLWYFEDIHQVYRHFHQVYHQMRQVFHQVVWLSTLVVFTHDSKLTIKNLIWWNIWWIWWN